MFFAPFLKEEISDYIAHGPIIRVRTVGQDEGSRGQGGLYGGCWKNGFNVTKVLC